MEDLRKLLGTEHSLDDVNRALKHCARHLGAAVVGAVQITCSDEVERECVDSFQNWFVQELLPHLKFWITSPFRIANLGGRYEWGAVPIAEGHFATSRSRDSFKLIVVRINAHVSVEHSAAGPRYGKMNRYQSDSVACGALHALLEGGHGPFVEDLREAFASEGKDRLAILLDPSKVEPSLRSLLAAVVSVRLQARRAVLDIQDHTPKTPTLYLVLACVTLNKPAHDSELVCGFYTVDRRAEENKDQYHGLGDDPSKYRVSHERGQLQVADEHLQVPRAARDHRQLVHREFRRPGRDYTRKKDQKLESIIREVKEKKHHDHPYAKELLKALLWVLADLSPVPAAALLFARGLAGMHHIYDVHRMLKGHDGHQEARAILRQIQKKLDRLPPGEAREIIELLLQEHGADVLP